MKMEKNPDHADTAVSAPVSVPTQGMGSPSKFQLLWQKAEKIRNDNHLLELSLEELVNQVRTQVGPVEQELGASLRRQIDKLITFASRKSVAQWQRDVLNQWILTTLDTLEDMGLVDVQLQNNLASLHASYLNINIDPDSELSPTEQLEEGMHQHFQAASQATPSGMQSKDDGDSIDDEYFDDVDDKFDFNRWVEERLAGLEGVAGEELYFLSDESDSKEVDPDKHLTLFKTLFHRVARALHPDKESDPEQRKIKQALMSQLLEARRKQDLMGVFEMYQAHVDQDVDFSEQDLIELESVLARFIAMEDERRVDLIMQSPTHHSVYERFYSKSPKTVTRKINRHIRDTREMKDRVDTFSQSVTSLKKLKPYLEERYDDLSVYL